MSYTIITISRQFGSGGRTIGKELAETLGIPCYDQELISMMAEKSGFSEEQVMELDEKDTKIFVALKQENSCVKIIVADSGVEIPPEQRQTIFEPFQCSDESRVAKDGSGWIFFTV